jgi:hypothetical protein
MPNLSQSIICVTWQIFSGDLSNDASFFLYPSIAPSYPADNPAYTDGQFVAPLGYASGGQEIPAATIGTPCPGPATVTIEVLPSGLDASWDLEAPGTPHELSGTGDAVLEYLPGGTYTIIWGEVDGFLTPSGGTESREVLLGEEVVFSGEYTEYLSAVPEAGGPGVVLHQNSPNPFNPATRLSFELDRAGPTRLAVYDVLGRLVRTLVDAPYAEGPHEVFWDGRDDLGRVLPAGVYIYRLESGEFVGARRMMLLK